MQAMQEAGAIAVVLPAHGFADDADALLDRMDGLLFSGGPDLDPATYGQARHPELGPDVDRVGDEYELALLREPPARDLPLLAICRGMQALNVSRGGTLHQHLPDRTGSSIARATSPTSPPTPVTVRAGSPLHRLTGRRRLDVNSFHHQAVDRLGARLEVIARAPDGTSRRSTTRRCASASASSGTPSCSRIAPSTRRLSCPDRRREPTGARSGRLERSRLEHERERQADIAIALFATSAVDLRRRQRPRVDRLAGTLALLSSRSGSPTGSIAPSSGPSLSSAERSSRRSVGRRFRALRSRRGVRIDSADPVRS